MSAISRRNQVTIPVDVLREAGLESGDFVQIFRSGPGRIELVKTDVVISEFAGILDARAYPPGYLEEVRRGWA